MTMCENAKGEMALDAEEPAMLTHSNGSRNERQELEKRSILKI